MMAGATLAAVAVLSGGCANLDASNRAERACGFVRTSLTMLATSHRDGPQGPAEAQKALVVLRKALPIAAEAASGSARYAPLATTLSESNRVPESRLVPALRQECSGIGKPGLPPPPPPGTTG